jgi:hypothetical protein
MWEWVMQELVLIGIKGGRGIFQVKEERRHCSSDDDAKPLSVRVGEKIAPRKSSGYW